MIYLLLAGVSAFMGAACSLGPATLLRPVLDAVSPLGPSAVITLCTMAVLVSSLVSAFFALGRPLPLDQDELILLAAGSALGGAAGDLLSARFLSMLPEGSALLLCSALLFTLLALPSVYFSGLSRTLRPLNVTRLAALPAAFFLGLLASFLAFGAEPLTLCVYYLLFDAENDEAALAALTVALFSMAGKLVPLLIRQRMALSGASALVWLLPGAILGTLAAMIPRLAPDSAKASAVLLRMCLFTCALNMAAALA